MNKKDSRWNEYERNPRPGEYRGFWKVAEKNYKLAYRTHLTFTNGKKFLFTAGDFREEAFVKMFDRIDEYHLDLDRELSLQG